MVQKKYKVSVLHLILYMLFLTVFPAQLLPFNIRFPFMAMFLVIGFLYVFSNLKPKAFFNKAFFCLMGVVLLSAINWRKGNITMVDLLQCFMHYFGIVLMYDAMQLFHKQGKDRDLLKVVISILIFYTVLNVISIVIIGIDERINLMYLFGNKFRVSYYIIYLIGLLYCLYNDRIKRNIANKMFFVIGAIIAMVFMYYITCKTGVVAVAFILILALFLKREYKLLSNVYFIIACVVLAGFVILVMDSIISMSFVQKIIHILKEDLQLSGRTRIYSTYLFPLINNSKWIGYGYSNTVMWNYSTAFGNAQNGLFDYILNNGIVGVVLFLLLIYLELRSIRNMSFKYGLYLVLYAMIIISVVEVNFGAFFLTIVFLIRWYLPEETQSELCNHTQ